MADYEVLFTFSLRQLARRIYPEFRMSGSRILSIITDDHGKWIPSNRLKYFHLPENSDYPINLKSDFEEYKKRDEEYMKTSLSKLTNYLMENDGLSFIGSTKKQQIITARYVLKHIMNTPYKKRPSDEWSILVTKFKNVIFMVRAKDQERAHTPERTYHYKFHQYVFSDSPNAKPVADNPYDENDLLFVLNQKVMDDFEILYASEINGVESTEQIIDLQNEKVLNECNFVLTRLLWERFDKPDWEKNPRLLGPWLQSYLSNLKKMIVGFKSDDGFIKNPIHHVDTENFPSNQYWKPEVCELFLRDFLDEIKAKMETVDCQTVLEFKFDANKQAITYRQVEDKSFINEEFIEFIEKKGYN